MCAEACAAPTITVSYHALRVAARLPLTLSVLCVPVLAWSRSCGWCIFTPASSVVDLRACPGAPYRAALGNSEHVDAHSPEHPGAG
jgi:hypothetical protein